jgi:hypothetical protein
MTLGEGMQITRRGFMQSILALAAAPAIVRADSLMRIVPTRTLILPATKRMLIPFMKSGYQSFWIDNPFSALRPEFSSVVIEVPVDLPYADIQRIARQAVRTQQALAA